MAMGSLMFTLLVHYVWSFVFNDSKDSLKKQQRKNDTTSLYRLHVKEWVGWVCV